VNAGLDLDGHGALEHARSFVDAFAFQEQIADRRGAL
jgi:hypothetical protein